MTANTLDGIIFDVDGTLWDSTETVAAAWNQAAEEFGGLNAHLSGVILKKQFGKPMNVIFKELFPSLSPKDRSRLEILCDEQERIYLKKTPGLFYPDVFDTIKTLSKSWPLFIVSNCQAGYIDLVLEAGKLSPFIKGQLCLGETGLSKGKTLRSLMTRFGLESAVYVGDTQGDREACQEAGIPFIWATYGFGALSEASAAECSIHKLNELSPLLHSFYRPTPLSPQG